MADTILAITILIGLEGEDWDYYETDPNWFAIRLWISRN